MMLPRTTAFSDESVRFGLIFACEDCGNFDATHNLCRHEWPTRLHRRDAGGPSDVVVFCKEFEAA
jgi:hypothetical protein